MKVDHSIHLQNVLPAVLRGNRLRDEDGSCIYMASQPTVTPQIYRKLQQKIPTPDHIKEALKRLQMQIFIP